MVFALKQCRSKVYFKNMFVIISSVACSELVKLVNSSEIYLIKIYSLLNLLACSRQNTCYTLDSPFQGF